MIRIRSEEMPAGQTPVTVTIVAHNDLVDAVQPGDRYARRSKVFRGEAGHGCRLAFKSQGSFAPFPFVSIRRRALFDPCIEHSSM